MALATSTVDRFGPSLVETSDGGTVPLEHLLEDDHGIECHADTHSERPPLSAFSVRNTRQSMLDRLDEPGPGRFCAGCHDLSSSRTGHRDRGARDAPIGRHHTTARGRLRSVFRSSIG